MANPPPPYSDITGISRTVMKDNAQETIANYNGNARPGEMVVNLLNNDVYIGNTNGDLSLISTGGGGAHADPSGPVGAVQINAGGNLFTGSANLEFINNVLSVVGNVTANVFSGKELTIISNVAATANVSAVNIIGNNSGAELAVVNTGVVIHASAPQDTPARVYVDGIGYSSTESTNAWAGFIGRSARGTLDAPSQLLAGDTITRLGGNPYNVDGFNPHTNTRIELVAAEDQTDATRGTQIEFWNTPIGSNTIAKTAVFNSDGIRLTGTNLNLVDGNDNDLVYISNVGEITFNGSSTLSLNGGFHVNTVGTNNGDSNVVNYVGGAFVYGPALKDYAGNIGANNVTITGILKAPQTTKASTATGTTGQICWDANYIYVCTATNTWKRSPLTGGY